LRDTRLESPIPPFGGGDHFDIGEEALVFVSKDPDLNPATHTKQNLYISLWKGTPGADVLPPEKVTIPGGYEGATSAPTLSPDGKAVAFLTMRKDGYESDKNHLLLIPDVRRSQWIEFYFSTPDGKGSWDRSPSNIAWSLDGERLFLLAENHGSVVIYTTASTVTDAKSTPQLLWNGGSTSVSGTSLFVTDIYSVTC
jgi:Tol biopolymer transport system component